ncbi:MAG: MFS transporter [Alphaproteobacteria bacterium]|nr:MFS transporter [Alphaproteobacteria bacterium]
MRSQPHTAHRHVSVGALHAYGLPNIAMSIVHLPTAIYVTPLYSQSLGLSLTAIGLIVLASRITDVFTDPIVGIFSDRNTTRIGRRKPWIIAGMPLMVGSIWMLFVPPEGASIFYLLVALSLYYLANTLMDLPYKAWGADMSPDYRERSTVTGYREAYGFVGLILTLALPVFLVQVGYTQMTDWVFALAITTAVAIPVLFLPPLLWLKEPAVTKSQRPPISWRRGLRIVWRNGPFLRLSVMSLFLLTTTTMTAALSLLFMTHVMGQAKHFPFFVMLYYFSSVAGIPVWLAISKRIGKHRALALSIFWLSLWSAPIPLLGPDLYYPFVALMMLKGSAVGAFYFLPTSMAADVVDIDTMRTGEARTGLYFSIWGMVAKGAAGVGTLIATMGTGYFGFDPTCASPAFAKAGATCLNTQSDLFALASFYSVIPAIVALACLPLLWSYPVTEERQKRIRARIAARHRAVPPGLGEAPAE